MHLNSKPDIKKPEYRLHLWTVEAVSSIAVIEIMSMELNGSAKEH